MAREGRNLVSILISNILNSLKPRRFRGDLIGRDSFGNKYYEIPGATKKSTSRWFEPAGGEKNFDRELPAEWEAWLRGRRIKPPSEEEMLKNFNLMKTAKDNADALQAEYKHGSETVNPPSGKVPFPKHEGFEINPGEKSTKS